jgi:ATP phosphoribosyltransferase regulatory subunit
MRKWVLPDSVEDVLPPAAAQMEQARRALLDAFAHHSPSYALVNPPLVEHLEALLTGTGRDLEASKFKLIDPLSGRMLGVRPDITPQLISIATLRGVFAMPARCSARTRRLGLRARSRRSAQSFLVLPR